MPTTQVTSHTKPVKLVIRGKQAKIQNGVREIKAAVAKHAASGNGSAIHGKPKLLSDPMFYPQHDKRTESPTYKASHQDMVVAKDLPCLVCGIRNSDLKDPKRRGDPKINPYGATQMETHHHVIEWALGNAIDPAKFARTILPNLKHKYPTEPMYQHPMSHVDILKWVDSEHNLWVLCDVHHRHKWVGIHEISYPLWCPQDFLDDDFRRKVQAEEEKYDAAGKTKQPAPKKPSSGRKAKQR
jgi:hypothetical protein